MGQVIAITVMKRGYQQVIYVNAEDVQVDYLGSFDKLDKTEQQLFGNTDLGNNYAIFDWESLDQQSFDVIFRYKLKTHETRIN